MKREIKFRGKSLQGDWVYGLPQQETTLSHTISFINQYFGEQRKYGRFTVSIIAETLGQFTGLKDKNGIEIYEGDILRINNCDKATACVIYEDMGLKIVDTAPWVNTNKGETNHFVYANFGNKLVVIGNIHENPELLT